jgi:hypothetical protein
VTAGDGALLGRSGLVHTVSDLALGGAEVLLYGPIGIGKTSILKAVAARTAAQGRPTAFAPETAGLKDVTRALAAAYPDARGPTQRRLRSSLRQRIEERPCVIVLDHVLHGSTALRGFLRLLRGTKAGVLFGVDTDRATDHHRARSLRLAYREIHVPPLGRRSMRRLLDSELASASLCLHAEDREDLLDLARGRPGWIVWSVRRLAECEFWRGDRVRLSHLRVELSTDVLRRYLPHGHVSSGTSRG